MGSQQEELDSAQVEVTINKPGRVLHFSDGVEEDIEQETNTDLENAPSATVQDVDPSSLSWMPWFSHYAWKSGSKVLNAVDYAGESLADLFGITTPKYQLELSEHERLTEEKKKMDEESVGWVPLNAGGDVPLVLQEPGKMIDKRVDV